MAKSANVYRDAALLALKADEGHWTEGATLEAIMQFAWSQLLYRRGHAELTAILAEFSEDLAKQEA